MRRIFLSIVAIALLATTALSQDPVKVDPKHYKVESENAEVRVLRIHYGPHEKSPMHSHPDSVAIFLTDGHTKFVLPDGKTQDSTFKAGDSLFTPPANMLPRT